jgi:hypothetical protein
MMSRKLWPYYLYVQNGERRDTFLLMGRESAIGVWREMKGMFPDCCGYILRVSEKQASLESVIV